MSDLVHRITTSLEPILDLADPRERISAYHDMPYALFRYEPEEEFELRKQITLLETRLTQKGKRVSRISLAQCLDEAMQSQRPLARLSVASTALVVAKLTVFFRVTSVALLSPKTAEFGQSTSIVSDSENFSGQPNSPSKSKAENYDGLLRLRGHLEKLPLPRRSQIRFDDLAI
jgi:hypothetical protein